MEGIYSRESGSLFPDSLLKLNNFKDIDDSVKDIMVQYYRFIESDNIDKALALKNAHPELEDYWITAAKLNLMKEEIQNIGMFSKLMRATVISEAEPDRNAQYDTGTVWLQPM